MEACKSASVATLLRENKYKEAKVETRAGYEILIKQTSASTSYIRAARKDLIADYDALKQPVFSSRFRAERTAVETATKK